MPSALHACACSIAPCSPSWSVSASAAWPWRAASPRRRAPHRAGRPGGGGGRERGVARARALAGDLDGMRRAVEERETGGGGHLYVRHKPLLARLREPAAALEVAEHDDVAAVG